jgi:hypothetical protein
VCRSRRFRRMSSAAVPFVPQAGMIRVGDDELRAASAEIVELYIRPGPCDLDLAGRLRTRYDVDVLSDMSPAAG